MPRLLLLISKRSYRAHDFLEAAKRLSIQVVVGSDHRQTLAELTPGTSLFLDFLDPENSTQAILDFAQKNPFQAIVTAEDDGALVATRAAQALGLPCNSVDSILATRNKYRMRSLLAQAPILQPSFRLISTEKDPKKVAQHFSYPSVIKPTFLSASRGVMRVDHPSDFEEKFLRLRKILNDPDVIAEGGEWAEKILVESYIPGIEVAFEGILQGGNLISLAVFDKPDPLEGPFFEETLYVTPSRLSETNQEQLRETVAIACRALGLETGPVHAELRLNRQGLWFIEIAARSIGGLCSRALRFGTGISLEELILRQALGDFHWQAREKEAAGVLMIPIPKAGILKEVRGKEEAKKVKGIEELDIMIPLGQSVVPLPEGSRYLGFLFARGPGPEEVESSLLRAHACLNFVIE